MKILFAGTPEPAAVALEYLLTGSEHEVVAVLTQPDARRGRGRTLSSGASHLEGGLDGELDVLDDGLRRQPQS